MNDENFTISTTLRRRVSLETRRLIRIKNHVLGKHYNLSLVFVGDARSKKLNQKYRKKQKPANVLSFSLSDSDGEMFINVPLAQREAKRSKTTKGARITHLFIHGTLHLKGFQHGAKMETQEQRLSSRFL